MDVLTRNNRVSGQRMALNSPTHSRETSTSSVHIDIGPEDIKWLKDAWVGRLKNAAMFERMEDDLWWEIGLDITPKYIGDDLLLLLGLNDVGAEQIMNGGQDGGTSMFYSMERWSPNLRTGSRLA